MLLMIHRPNSIQKLTQKERDIKIHIKRLEHIIFFQCETSILSLQ